MAAGGFPCLVGSIPAAFVVQFFVKRTFVSLALPGLLAVAVLLASCASSDVKKSAETFTGFETPKQISAMPPCKATLEQQQPCSSIFRTADGRKFNIGSPAATPEVVQFLQTLKQGQTYEFPGVFLNYQKK